MEETKISELQRKVLKVLAEYYNSEMNCMYIKFIAEECGIDYRQARLAVRALARKGLANYERGLFDEDGMVAGSGYYCTFNGALLVTGCHNKEKCGNIAVMVTGECHDCWEKRRLYEFTCDYGKHKKGDKVTRSAFESDEEFKRLFFGTLPSYFDDKKIVDCTPDPDWVCKDCGCLECQC